MFPFILGLLSCLCTHVSAETTLYIPGANEQPLSVQQIGTDNNGRTSWVIGPGTPTGTFTDQNVKFNATLVEGPSDAILQGSIPGGPAFSYSCAIAGSQANCQLVASDPILTETTTIIELVSPFLVQGGGTSSPSPTSSSGLPSSTLTSIPLTSPPLSTTQQPTATSLSSAYGRDSHMSWAWLALGLLHVFYNI